MPSLGAHVVDGRDLGRRDRARAQCVWLALKEVERLAPKRLEQLGRYRRRDVDRAEPDRKLDVD